MAVQHTLLVDFAHNWSFFVHQPVITRLWDDFFTILRQVTMEAWDNNNPLDDGGFHQLTALSE